MGSSIGSSGSIDVPTDDIMSEFVEFAKRRVWMAALDIADLERIRKNRW